MREWSNPWNPFNSAKVLLWKEHLRACSNDIYLPPISVDLDPSNNCMYDCPHCNAYDMIRNSGKIMSEDHMIKLIDFLADWRDSWEGRTPNSACVSGGGEPYMNSNINTLFERMHSKGMEIGIITTGFLLTDVDIKIMSKTARWIGFSMDASNSLTYTKVKGISSPIAFDKVVMNMKKLVRQIRRDKSKCDIAFKFLLTPENSSEVYEAIKLAKEIGVKDFHLRPAGWDNISKVTDKPTYTPEMIDSVNEQIKEGMRLETKYFRVFGIRHKFNPDFSKKVNFKRCWAIPILPTFGADGNVHLCFDMRGRDDLILCRHEPDPSEILKVWNSDFHKNMVKGIDVEKCPRCTFGAYNEIVEQVIIDDSMCINFP